MRRLDYPRAVPRVHSPADPMAQPSPTDAASPLPPGTRVGVDTGGTFTDLVLAVPGEPPRIAKVASTPADPGRALVEGLEALGVPGARGATVVHGTTVALNALLTGSTGDAALVTNEGFEDLVEIDRQARPDLYAMEPARPAALIPRERRFGLPQRSWPAGGPGGQVEEARRPSEEELAALCDRVEASGARSVAVCLLHSYADPEPERRVARALAARGLECTTSSGLVAEYREAERFSTAVCNAALVPVVRAYLERLDTALPEARLEVLQSSGGGLPAARAASEPVRVLLSGPAGGVVGAARAAAAAGLGSIATLDMGGTSTDVAFHSPGAELSGLADEVRVAGHAIAVPTLDMHTVGCGGGSLARVDGGGVLRVGPESAGADPGPVAFGRGGDEPTVTDAHVVLGRIAPLARDGGFLGGSLSLDVDAAMAAYDRLGATLGVDRYRAAQAVVDAANASMRRALGVMTMQRGRDPRATPLVAFGGGGGLAAAELARALGMPSALVPSDPGVLSASGMTHARRSVDRSATVLRPVRDVGAAELASLRGGLQEDALAVLAEGGDLHGTPRVEASLALRYRGQSYELSVPWCEDPEGAFHRAHAARFGWTLDDQEVQLVHVRLRATEAPNEVAAGGDTPGTEGTRAAAAGEREVRFGGAAVRAAVHHRGELRHGDLVQGPAVIEEYSGTTVVPPGARARVVGGDGLLIEDEA